MSGSNRTISSAVGQEQSIPLANVLRLLPGTMGDPEVNSLNRASLLKTSLS